MLTLPVAFYFYDIGHFGLKLAFQEARDNTASSSLFDDEIIPSSLSERSSDFVIEPRLWSQGGCTSLFPLNFHFAERLCRTAVLILQRVQVVNSIWFAQCSTFPDGLCWSI